MESSDPYVSVINLYGLLCSGVSDGFDWLRLPSYRLHIRTDWPDLLSIVTT